MLMWSVFNSDTRHIHIYLLYVDDMLIWNVFDDAFERCA